VTEIPSPKNPDDGSIVPAQWVHGPGTPDDPSAAAHFDIVILGQGLAGTTLAWWLRWKGLRVLVIDRDDEVTSSKIAAGLMTPITGQKLVKTWRLADLWPAAVSFYRRVELETNSSYFREVSMVRLLANPVEASLFDRRLASGEFEERVLSRVPLINKEWLHADFHGFEMGEAGQLDVARFMRSSRDHFRKSGGHLETDLDVSREIELVENGIRIPRLKVRSNRIVFCQGIAATTNPWFLDVDFRPAKGEILTVRVPGLTEDRVFHHGVWLAPLGDNLFKVGSTYDWKHLDNAPTMEGRDEILARLSRFLRLPVEIVNHEAAVRPIHRNQFPILGVHPHHSQLGFFNGLGSKGSLQAPFFAEQFARFLVDGGKIDPEVDLNRKTRWRSLDRYSPSTGRGRPDSGFHVERPLRRSLTEQAQDAVWETVLPGDIVIDATAGNGHDTHFLANQVGPDGTVFAFDLQQIALDKTKKRLIDAGLENVVLLNHDHGEMEKQTPREKAGQIAAVMFNLGYLPGGDKRITTHIDSTVRGIECASRLLRPGGVMTVLAYTGHEGGMQESVAVQKAIGTLAPEFELSTIEGQPGQASSPILFLVKRELERKE
jgi:glycine/D-amino acid oxidase-like deaminating enzyme/ubiquinone/menaquinone biosynthesis C-methylase UbiE